MTAVALVLASVALAVAITTAAAVAYLIRQSAETTSDLRAHRRAHTIAFGHADPKLDRRQVNIGAPRTVGERRGTRYQPPPERLAPRPTPPPPVPPVPVDDDPPPTPPEPQPTPCGQPHPDNPARRCPLPAGHDGLHRLDDTATGELEQQDTPTALIPAQQRPEPGGPT